MEIWNIYNGHIKYQFNLFWDYCSTGEISISNYQFIDLIPLQILYAHIININ